MFVKFEKLMYAVKISIDNSYVIYPHNYLCAREQDNDYIGIYTIGKDKLVLSIRKEDIYDIDYRNKSLDIINYINKQL